MLKDEILFFHTDYLGQSFQIEFDFSILELNVTWLSAKSSRNNEASERILRGFNYFKRNFLHIKFFRQGNYQGRELLVKRMILREANLRIICINCHFAELIEDVLKIVWCLTDFQFVKPTILRKSNHSMTIFANYSWFSNFFPFPRTQFWYSKKQDVCVEITVD